MDGGAWWAAVHGIMKSRTWLSDFTFTFHFLALEKEMATHSSVLAWRIPGTGEPDGLPSMGSHRVGHDWSDFTAAAAGAAEIFQVLSVMTTSVFRLVQFGHIVGCSLHVFLVLVSVCRTVKFTYHFSIIIPNWSMSVFWCDSVFLSLFYPEGILLRNIILLLITTMPPRWC